MIEAYAFLAAFALQILAVSVLNPARFVRYVRGWETSFGSERLAELYPGYDFNQWAGRFATRYRAANIVIAGLGLLLLAWLSTLIQHPDWTSEVAKLTALYFLLQMSPLIFLGLYVVVRYRKRLMQPTQDAKRKAVLQRRGLFDFISPLTVAVAVLSYFLFVVLSIYFDLHFWHNTTLSRACLLCIGSGTLAYLLNAFIIYKYLYGRKNPLVTHEGRAHMIGRVVKGSVYSSIAVAWYFSLMAVLSPPESRQWYPFVLCMFLIVSSLLGFSDLTVTPRKPEIDALGTGTAR